MELAKYKTWFLQLSDRIDRAITNVGGQMTVNYQLVVANDNFNHYRDWAEKNLREAHRVTKSQRFEIELLERANGNSPFHAALNGHISTQNQEQINGFAD